MLFDIYFDLAPILLPIVAFAFIYECWINSGLRVEVLFLRDSLSKYQNLDKITDSYSQIIKDLFTENTKLHEENKKARAIIKNP